MWADKTFSDGLAVYTAYKTWKQKKETRFFERRTANRRERKKLELKMEWAEINFISLVGY